MGITLAGIALPDPNSYSVSPVYRGSGSVMADGSTRFDLMNGTPKNSFIFGYVLMTNTEKAAMANAWAGLKTGGAEFVDYDGLTYTVTRDSSSPNLVFDFVKTSGGPRWATTVNLLEV